MKTTEPPWYQRRELLDRKKGPLDIPDAGTTAQLRRAGCAERAIQVFWSKGDDGVTIDDLVAGMGVGRPSLYSVFGGKRAIFVRALKAYVEKKGALAAEALLAPHTLRDSLASFLEFAVTFATTEASAPGCLLLCIAPLVDDAEIQQFLQGAAAGALALVERRFPRRDQRGRGPV